jgi:hypothetical protein
MCIVRRWDEQQQAFLELLSSEEASYQEGVRNFDFDRNLAYYFNNQLGEQNYSNWVALSSYINQCLINRIQLPNPYIKEEEKQ